MGILDSQLHTCSPYTCLESVIFPNSRAQKKKKFKKEYSIGATLGKGAFGVVKSCTQRRTGKKFAVKMVVQDATSVEDTTQEANMMQSLNHRNIIRFHGIYYEKDFIHMVMDRYLGGDLLGWLEKRMSMKEVLKCEEVVCAVQQMCASIHYLHCHDIMHRDIKGDNYLLDGPSLTHPQCRLVLADFGAACFAKPNDRLHTQVGTKVYWAPELYDEDYGRKVDIWALGVIVYSLVTGHFPFREEADVKLKPLRIPSNVTNPCTDFIKVLLSKDEASRPYTEEVVNHEWMVPPCMPANNGFINASADNVEKPDRLPTSRSHQLSSSSSFKTESRLSGDTFNNVGSDELFHDENKGGPDSQQINREGADGDIKFMREELPNLLKQGNSNKSELHVQAPQAVKQLMAKNFKEARLSTSLMESYGIERVPFEPMGGWGGD